MSNGFELSSSDFRIIVEDRRIGNWHTEADAIIALISVYDSESRTEKGDMEAPYRFYDKILCALAAHYSRERPDEEPVPLKDIVEHLVEECSEKSFSQLHTLSEGDN